MGAKPPVKDAKPKKLADARAERLAAALRENLKRRKAQAKLRAAKPAALREEGDA
jgi:hypothetical protein